MNGAWKSDSSGVVLAPWPILPKTWPTHWGVMVPEAAELACMNPVLSVLFFGTKADPRAPVTATSLRMTLLADLKPSFPAGVESAQSLSVKENTGPA
jgi:hypothetical protein